MGNKKVYLCLPANPYMNFDKPFIEEGELVVKKSEMPGKRASKGIHIEKRIYRDGSTKQDDRMLSYSPVMIIEHSLEMAQLRSKIHYHAIDEVKALPRIKEPNGPYAKDYFAVLNIPALSFDQLCAAQCWAQLFRCSDERMREEKHRRFKEGAFELLDKQIAEGEEKKVQPSSRCGGRNLER